MLLRLRGINAKRARRLYNEVRPHSSLGKMTPKAYAGMIGNNLNQGATLKN